MEDSADSATLIPAARFGVLTLSCGVSGVAAGNRRLLNWRQVFDEADNALYRVKRARAQRRRRLPEAGQNVEASVTPPGFQRGYRAARASRR